MFRLVIRKAQRSASAESLFFLSLRRKKTSLGRLSPVMGAGGNYIDRALARPYLSNFGYKLKIFETVALVPPHGGLGGWGGVHKKKRTLVRQQKNDGNHLSLLIFKPFSIWYLNRRSKIPA